MAVVGWVVMVALVGWFAARAWFPRLGAADRRRLVADGVSALVVLMLGRAITPMPGVQSWLWVVLAAVVAVSVVRAVHRGAGLPWVAPVTVDGRPRPGRLAPALVGVVGNGLVGVLAFVVLL